MSTSPHWRSQLAGYAAAAASVALTCAVRLLLDPWLGDEAPFILSVPAVLFSAWYGGIGPALVALTLGAGLGAAVMVSHAPWQQNPAGHASALAIYLGSCALVVALAAAQRRAHARAQREAEARLAHERRWGVTLRSIGDGVIITDPEQRITLLNAVAETLTGWPQAEAAGRPCREVFRIIDQFSRDEAANPLCRALEDGVTTELANHTVLLTRDGREIAIDDSAAPVRDDQGAITGGVLVFRDVTTRRQTEQRVRRQAQLVELAHDAIIVHDLSNRAIFWNAAAEGIYGWSRDEAMGQVVHELMQTRFPRSYEEVQSALETEGSWEGELTHTRRDGARITVDSRWALQRDEAANPLAILEIVRDITDRRRAEERLAQSRSELQAIYDNAPVMLCVLDGEGKISFANRSFADFVGPRRMATALRAPLGNAIGCINALADPRGCGFGPECGSCPLRRAMADTLASGKTHHGVDRQIAFAEGEGRPDVFVTASMAPIETGGRPGLLLCMQDITDRKRYEQRVRRWNEELEASVAQRTAALDKALAAKDEVLARERQAQDELRVITSALYESEASYRLLFDTCPLPVVVVDAHSMAILAVNTAASTHYGYSRREFLTKTIQDIQPDDTAAALYQRVSALPGEDDFAVVATHRKRDGTTMTMEVVGRGLRYAGQPAWLVLATDVTERQRSEEQLRHSFEQARRLAQHLQSVREEERAEVAREVHDELGQSLTGLKMDTAWILGRLGRAGGAEGADGVAARVEAMSALIDQTIQAVRRIATELRPAVLDTLGLVAAIEWQTRDYEDRTGTACEFASDADDARLGHECSTALFRILQESLTNVARHAEATRVRVRLEAEPCALRLEVADDGVGISEQALTAGNSLGLLGMRERALVFGGHVHIAGRPGKGTVVRATLPCPCPNSECTAWHAPCAERGRIRP